MQQTRTTSNKSDWKALRDVLSRISINECKLMTPEELDQLEAILVSNRPEVAWDLARDFLVRNEIFGDLLNQLLDDIGSRLGIQPEEKAPVGLDQGSRKAWISQMLGGDHAYGWTEKHNAGRFDAGGGDSRG